ncbi:hypothetical protein LJB76_02145 [Clostridia bacterium OttesenSCG-928-O13]|nr:hypothetical protein [Clostridia bacterium OttesenSCG-928-O13]
MGSIASCSTIKIRAGATSILSTDIDNTIKLNETYCGIMRDGVTGIPTNAILEQATDLLEGIKANADGTLDLIEAELARLNAGTEVMLKTEFAPDATITVEDTVATFTSEYAHPNNTHLVAAYDGFPPYADGPWNTGKQPIIIDGDEVQWRVFGRNTTTGGMNQKMPIVGIRHEDKFYNLNHMNMTPYALNLYVDPVNGVFCNLKM